MGTSRDRFSHNADGYTGRAAPCYGAARARATDLETRHAQDERSFNLSKGLAAMIRYRKLGYVELMVTDLERSAAFYRDVVGLEPAGEGPEGERRFRCSEDPYAVVLHKARSRVSGAAAGCSRTSGSSRASMRRSRAQASPSNR
jgi:Glyoxalase/Bleomycin resistance protein/Dioxygenase superfamily